MGLKKLVLVLSRCSTFGNYTGAIEFYNKTLAIDPNNTFALTNKDAILHMLETMSLQEMLLTSCNMKIQLT